MRKAIVTGGAGFIGSHLVEELLRSGWKVVVIDDLSTGKEENLPNHKSLTFVRQSITDSVIAEYFQGVAVVFHLAALVSVPYTIEHPVTSHDINVNGTLNVLEIARLAGVGRVVFMSSAAVYGSAASTPVSESAPTKPESPYGLHKVLGEEYMKLYSALYGVETICFRGFNIYGPRQRDDSPYSGAVAKFISQAQAGERPTIFGDGNQVRDFIYVKDIVRLLVAGAETKDCEGIFNAGSGTGTTVNDLAAHIWDIHGATVDPRYAPTRTGDIRNSVADMARTSSTFSLSLETDLKDGIRHIVQQ